MWKYKKYVYKNIINFYDKLSSSYLVICNNDQFVTYLINYNKDLLPFDETKLEPFNSAKGLFGDYKGTLIFQKTKKMM